MIQWYDLGLRASAGSATLLAASAVHAGLLVLGKRPLLLHNLSWQSNHLSLLCGDHECRAAPAVAQLGQPLHAAAAHRRVVQQQERRLLLPVVARVVQRPAGQERRGQSY